MRIITISQWPSQYSTYMCNFCTLLYLLGFAYVFNFFILHLLDFIYLYTSFGFYFIASQWNEIRDNISDNIILFFKKKWYFILIDYNRHFVRVDLTGIHIATFILHQSDYVSVTILIIIISHFSTTMLLFLR